MAVLGAGTGAEPRHLALGEELGRHLALAGAVVLCGGLGGVMEAAARGAAQAGALVVGILPGPDRLAANPHVHVSLATGLGEARNALLVRAADACVAVGGGWGTLSEIALARRMGKPVVALSTWRLQPPPSGAADPLPPAGASPGGADPLFRETDSPAEAAVLALTLAGAPPPPLCPDRAPPAAASPLPWTDPGRAAAASRGTAGDTPDGASERAANSAPGGAAAGTPVQASYTGQPGRPGTWTVSPATGGAPLAQHPNLAQALRLAGVALAGDPPPRPGGPGPSGLISPSVAGGEVRIGRRLVMSPGVANGQVRLDGTELAVGAVLERLAETLSVAGLREHYPILSEAEVAACLRFAADVLAGVRLR